MKAGTVIADRFEVEGAAGRGAFGEVYRARDRSDGKTVAVKVLRASAGGPDDDAFRRFEREARLLATLRHPAIVGHVAHGRLGSGVPFMVLEWIEGLDLARCLRSGPLSLDATVELADRLLDALTAAHLAGVIHRDLKPENVLLDGSQIAGCKLADFGVARHLTDTVSLTQSGVLVGTPPYMAPEQVRGLELDARADLFSLGCLLVECVTGRRAFEADHSLAVLAQIVFEEPDLRAVPRPLRDFVRHLLAKQPEARPTDCPAAREELRRLIDSGSRADGAEDAIVTGELRAVAVVLVGRRAAPVGAGVDRHETVKLESAVTQRSLHRLHSIASAQGAQVERLLDGTVAALVCGESSATDLAARGAHLALDLRRIHPDEPMSLAMGRAVLSGSLPLGPVLERAVSLLDEQLRREDDDRGRPRPVRIDELGRDLLQARFRVEMVGTDCWLHAVRAEPAPARQVGGGIIPFVGRDQQLKMLDAVYETCAADAIAQLALVTGPAGAGKSRLLAEWRDRRREAEGSFAHWVAHSDPTTSHSPYAGLLNALRSQCGIEPDDAPELARDRLRQWLTGRLEPEAVDHAVEFLSEIMGAPVDDTENPALRAARGDRRLMGDQLQQVWEAILAAECRERPLVLVIEDLHWADAATLNLVGALARGLADRPLAVIALAREGAEPAGPWSEPTCVRLPLPPLSRLASEAIVRHLLGDVPDERVRPMIERAAGNPFFLEELGRAALDGQPDTPESILLTLQCRLEALPAACRQVLRGAAVFGDSVPRDGLASVLADSIPDDEVSGALAALVEGNWLRRRGPRYFAFVHALVRDAALSMMPEPDLRAAHMAAARWLEHVSAIDPFVLAEHFEHGGAHPRSVYWYRQAADRALQASDLASALSISKRAIALGAAGIDRAHLGLIQAEAHNWRAEHQHAEDEARLAFEQLPRESDEWARAANHLQWAIAGVGRYDELAAVADAIHAVDPRHWTASHVATLAWIASWLFGVAGRVDEGISLLEAVERALPPAVANDPTAQAGLASARADRAAVDGNLGARLVFARRALAAREEIGDQRLACLETSRLATVLADIGMFDQAEELFRRHAVHARRLGMVEYASDTDVWVWYMHARRVTSSKPARSRRSLCAPPS